ncbi:LytR/AlgR family response regulator transcription factor [Jiulongibacter sp. NS-SX5]|uniref:LytR/AlgR family response regulator transcription factor n=1 Tax=Jiulongibacter sp. NS-SX5 TaxID=3463854 RepID=UPI0040587A81
MNLIRKFLNQPYSFYFEGIKLWQIILVIYLLAQFYNSVIQPFDVYHPELKYGAFVTELIHSAIPVIVILYIAFILKLFPRMTDRWTLKKELILFVIILLQVGLIDFLIRDIIYDNPNNWSWHYLQEEVLNTLMGGMLIVIPVIFINLNLQLLKNQERAEAISIKKEENVNVNKVFIKTPLTSESFELHLGDLLYVNADGNYLKIYSQGGQEVLKRMTLSGLEDLLKESQNILRVHRSYLVNLTKIESVTGNAQGYKLRIKGTAETVPVSRTYLEVFDQKMTV